MGKVIIKAGKRRGDLELAGEVLKKGGREKKRNSTIHGPRTQRLWYKNVPTGVGEETTQPRGGNKTPKWEPKCRSPSGRHQKLRRRTGSAGKKWKKELEENMGLKRGGSNQKRGETQGA